MDIKPPLSSRKPSLDPSALEKTNSAEKSGKFEAQVRSERSEPAPSSTAASALSNLKARFSKRDLEDSTKVETVLNGAIDEVLGGLPENLQLPSGGRQAVTDLMAKDPVIRGRLMNLLRNTLD